MYKEISSSDPHLSFHYRVISQASTLLEAREAFSKVCFALTERAALFFYPLVKVVASKASDEKTFQYELTESLLTFFKTKVDPRSIEICAELGFEDLDAAVLSRFAKQIAFEEACING